LKQFLEAALDVEMNQHLYEDEHLKGGKRNGKGTKTLKTMDGTVTIETPEDRQSSFTPNIVKKRETVLAENLASKIIGLYGLGMSFHDISSNIEEMYDVEVSHST
jgi:transposase-like protein